MEEPARENTPEPIETSVKFAKLEPCKLRFRRVDLEMLTFELPRNNRSKSLTDVLKTLILGPTLDGAKVKFSK